MTIDQLLECSASDLEKMTDEQLLEHFKPYLTATRPELAKLNKPPTTQKKGRLAGVKDEDDIAMELALQFGVKLNL